MKTKALKIGAVVRANRCDYGHCRAKAIGALTVTRASNGKVCEIRGYCAFCLPFMCQGAAAPGFTLAAQVYDG